MLLKTQNNFINYKIYILIILSFILVSPKTYSTDLTACGTLSSPGTYVLQNDINQPGGTCINITSNNITLDCNHHKIFDSNTGINIDKNNITIQNCDINVLNYGIKLKSNANHNQILHSKIVTTASYTTSPGYAGIYSGAWSGPTIADNNIIDCNIFTTGNYNFGILFMSVSDSLIKDTNIITLGAYSQGLALYISDYNNVIDNVSVIIDNVAGNRYCLLVDLSSAGNLIKNSSFVANVGNPVIFQRFANNNIIQDSNILSKNNGVYFYQEAYNNTVKDSNILAKYIGLRFYANSHHNIVQDSNILSTNSGGYGAYFTNTHDNNIINSTITSTQSHGVYFDINSYNNLIEDSNILSFGVGLYVKSIYFNKAHDNNIIDCNITSTQGSGVYFERAETSNNLVKHSNISIISNFSGVEFWETPHDNNIIDCNITSAMYGIIFGNYSYNNLLTDSNILATGSGGYGAYFTNTHDNNIINSTITSTQSHGVYFSTNSYNNIIEDSNILSTSNIGAYFLNTHDNNIVNSTITSTQSHGVYFDINSYNNLIEDSNILSFGVGLYVKSIYFNKAHDNNIIDCNITSTQGSGVFFTGAETSNNLVKHSNISIISNFSGVEFWETPHDNNIIDCNITSAMYGIVFGKYSYNNLLTDSNIYINITGSGGYGAGFNNTHDNNIVMSTITTTADNTSTIRSISSYNNLIQDSNIFSYGIIVMM